MTVGLGKQCFSTYNFFKETENISHFQMTKIHILRVPQAANLNSWDFGPMQKSSLTFVICCCCCSVAKSRPTLCDPVDCSTPGFSVLHYLWSFLTLQSCLMSIESVMLLNHLILCRLPLLLPSIFPSIRVFSKESALCIR